MRLTSAALAWVLFGAVMLCAESQPPRYTEDGQLLRPDDYREWIFLSSGLGMTYGPAAQASTQNSPLFDNVFVRPESYRAFLQTGTWPAQTMFVLEVRRSTSEGSINRGGRFQDEIVGVEAAVKDETRFADKWAYFGFGSDKKSAKAFPKTSCHACHATNGAVDNTFVQFYPTLRDVAKAKGIFKETPRP